MKYYLIPKKEEPVVPEKSEEPSLEVPSIPEETKVEEKKNDTPATPMWEMPKWEEPVIEEPKVKPPVWNIPTSSENKEEDKIVSAVPLWENIKPKLGDNTPNNLDTNIDIFNTPSNSTNY